MVKIIPIASGKGGVGKTTLTASLAVLFAEAGKTVVAVDLDLGGSNLHTCLGLKNNREGISSMIFGREKDLGKLVMETSYPRVYMIPGDGLIPGTTNLPFYVKKRIIAGLRSLTADIVLVDLGSGTSTNTLDFFLLSSLGILVTAPETTAILNAYSFIKTALFRQLLLTYPAKAQERKVIEGFMSQKLEGSGLSLPDLIDELYKISPDSGRRAQDVLYGYCPGVILNMGRTPEDFQLGGRLREITKKNLGVNVSYLGFTMWEDLARNAVNQRIPLAHYAPQGWFRQNLIQVRDSILKVVEAPRPEMFWESEEDDLDTLARLQKR